MTYIGALGHGYRVRVQLDDRVHAGPVLIELENAADVEVCQVHGRQRVSGQLRLELRHRHFVELAGRGVDGIRRCGLRADDRWEEKDDGNDSK